MTPEDKFKQWALDPNGGGWTKEPPIPLDEDALFDLRPLWELEKAAFLAGYNADRWIRVGDGLPEDKIWVLAYVPVRLMPFMAFREDLKWASPFNAVGLGVTHWQPLPNKPKI